MHPYANRALASSGSGSFELESNVDSLNAALDAGRAFPEIPKLLNCCRSSPRPHLPPATLALSAVVAAAIMRLFGRKGSKPIVSPNGSQPNSSNGSLRSPGPTPNGSRPTSFPDVPLPKAPDPALDPAGYLRSIYAVRERSKLVLEKAKMNQLKHFTVDMTKFHDVASFVVSIIKVGIARGRSDLRAADGCHSETMRPTTPPSHPMAAGSTLMLAAVRASTS